MSRARRIPSWCEVTHYKVGDVLWHGTAKAYGFATLSRPAWVSDSHVVASNFARWRLDDDRGVSRVMRYVVARPFTLPTMSGRSNEALGLWIQRVVDNRPPAGDEDDLYYEGYEEHEIDAMAAFVCRAGFHGWRITDNYGPGDDILLCKPDLLLRRAQAGPHRRPRG